MSKAAYLGIDIGTSGIRASCINDTGEELVNHRIAFAETTPPTSHADGVVEQDPVHWLTDLERLLKQISTSLQQYDDSYRIKAIAIDGTSSTVIACSSDGVALSPAMMYNDQQSQDQAETIRKFAPVESAVHGASSSLAKALLLLTRFPETELFCHQADWVAASLTGQYGFSDDNNCLKMGYDSITGTWPEWLFDNEQNTALIPSMLPEVQPPGTRLSAITSDLIERYGFDEDCTLVSGTTDSNAAVLATGASSPGDAVTSLGSTLVLKLFSDRPVFEPELGIYSHRLNGSWLVGGASNSGGNVLLKYFDRQKLDELSAQIDPDEPTGLDYYPLASTGERFPANDSHKRPCLDPRPESDTVFLQGLLEGMANIEAEGYERLAALGATRPGRIYTAGGGSRNQAWRMIRQQAIRERITGTMVVTAAHTEASYGSALLARQGYRT